MNPKRCASQDMFVIWIVNNNWENIQNIIKVLAFIVIGIKNGNNRNARILALGKIYKYAPIKAATTPEAPTTGVMLEGFKIECP